MSAKVAWGGIAGLAASVLLIISAILNQMSRGSGASSPTSTASSSLPTSQ
jgi:hypothetical protein